MNDRRYEIKIKRSVLHNKISKRIDGRREDALEVRQ